ncbi:MAG: glycosyltransferase family 2 protein [Promethearchaeota archaeon]
MELSVILPIYNEAENIEELFLRLKSSLMNFYKDSSQYEIIFVNDGSTDGSLEIIYDIINKNKKEQNLKLVNHESRRTHAQAIASGFRATGNTNYTIVMNADLQYNPRDILDFIKEVKASGYKIINGYRKNRVESILKQFVSRIYNLLMISLLNSPVKDNASNFTLYHTSLIKNAGLEFDDQRYIISKLVRYHPQLKDKIKELKIRQYKRAHGVSKYPVKSKILHGFFEFLFKWKEIKYGLPLLYLENDYLQNGNLQNGNLQNSNLQEAPNSHPEEHIKMGVSIVIPVKNEQDNIIILLENLINEFIIKNNINTEIIVINDQSTDATYDKLHQFKKKVLENKTIFKKCHIVILNNIEIKHSVGRAIRLGIFNASSEYIITMDGDRSHIPSEAVEIYKKLKLGHDLVIGGRYMDGQKPFEPIERYKISKRFNQIIQLFYGERISDYTTGFRGFKRSLYDRILIISNGFEIHPELNIKLLLESSHAIELPIHYIKRTKGASKLRYWKVFLRYVLRVLTSRFI